LTVTSASYLALGMTDMWFVGHLGTTEQAGVGIGLTLTLTVGAFVWGVLRIVEAFVSQHYGAATAPGADPALMARCGQSQRETMVIGVGLAVLTAALIPAVRFLANHLGASPDVSRVAADYAAMRTVGTAFTCLSDVLKGFFRSINWPRIPMWLAVASVVVNVPLDAWFVGGGLGLPAMASTGAALSTVTITIAELAALVAIYQLGPYARRFGALVGPIDGKAIARQIRVGVPIGISWLALQGGYMAFWAVVARFGDQALGAHAILARLTEILIVPAGSIGITVSILVAQALGARDGDRARGVLRSGLRLVVVCAAVIAGLIWIAGEPVVRAFSNDEVVVAAARDLFPWVMAFQALSGLGLVLRGVLQGSGDTASIMWVSIAEPFLVLLPLTWVLGVVLDQGLFGAWLASVISVGIASGAVLLRVLLGRWDQGSLIAPPAPIASAVGSQDGNDPGRAGHV
jgi:MATE family multidrug resistance protein